MVSKTIHDERILAWLLYVVGAVCLVAIFPFFMPVEWMAGTHEWLGLGEFPNRPIAEYLARGMSGMCALYGGFLVVLARDVRRYHPVIVFQAVAILFLATFGTWMAVRAGIPFHLVGGDAICCWLYAIPMLILCRRIARASAKEE